MSFVDDFIFKHYQDEKKYNRFYFLSYCMQVLLDNNEDNYNYYKQLLFSYRQNVKMGLIEFISWHKHLVAGLTPAECSSFYVDFLHKQLQEIKKMCFVFSYKNVATFYVCSMTEEDSSVFTFLLKKIVSCPRFFSYLEDKKKSHCRTLRNLRSRINSIINNNDNVYFVTLTFNDNAFLRLDKVTRRRYVSRLMKSFSKSYVANLDYGEEKFREHYHGIAVIDDVSKFNSMWFDEDKFNCGFTYLLKVTNSDKSKACLTSYTNKLVTHCLKHGADRIIYSRS